MDVKKCVVEELSSLVTTIPEDQMVTVQEEEVITEEVMDEGVAVPKRPALEPLTPNSKKAKLALKPKLSKGEGKKRAKAEGVPKKKKRPSIKRRTPKASRGPVDRRKAQSAYILFSREHRAQVVADNPKDKMTEITSKLGKMWSALPESEKTFWRNAQGPSDSKPKHSKRTPAPPPPDTAPEALDYAAHLKLLGDSITKMGEITGELYEQGDYSDLTVSALLTTLLDCLLCASAPLIYLSSHIDQIKVIPEEQQIRTLDNIAFIMPGLENFKS